MATDQVPLAYDYDGEGRLLVAIHGITENRHFWDRVPLSRHFRVLRVDLRGHGDTPPAGPYTFETAADDVHKLVSRLAPGETPLVVGHSLGGVVATTYGSRYPVRGIVNVDQALNVSPLPAAVADTVRGDEFESFMNDLFAKMYGDLDPSIAKDLTSRRNLRQDVVLGFWRPLLELDSDALDAWLDGIVTMPAVRPYLSLHGFDPGEGYPAWLRHRIPGALVERAPVATHYPHLAEPEWFVSRLLAFDAAASPQ